MSEHQKHTEFLRHCIRYDESAGRVKLENEIARIQRDLRCVGRAVWLMAILISLVVFALAYGTIFVQNFPYNAPQFIVNLIYAVGLGSLVSLLAFMGLGMVYRWRLDHRREGCRQLVARLLESRLGKPATAASRVNRSGEEDARRDRELAEGSPASLTGGIEPGNQS